MNYAYWKPYDNKNYSLEEAIKEMLKYPQKDIEMRVYKDESYKMIAIDKEHLPEDLDNLQLPLWAIRDPYWHLYIPDHDTEDKVDELRDYLNEVYQVDSRFYDVDKMDIGEIFDQFEMNVFDDDIRMKILFWLRDNNMIKKLY